MSSRDGVGELDLLEVTGECGREVERFGRDVEEFFCGDFLGHDSGNGLAHHTTLQVVWSVDILDHSHRRVVTVPAANRLHTCISALSIRKPRRKFFE